MPADDSDHAAHFEQIYGCSLEQSLGWMFPTALKLTHWNHYDADDLVQDTVEHLLMTTPRNVPPSAPRPYIVRTLTNQFIDGRRRNGAARRGGNNTTQPLSTAQGLAASEPGPEGEALTQEMRKALRKAIQRLPQHEKEVVELALDYVDMGLDYRSRAEIARELGIPVGTVKRRLHDAIQKLRQLIEHPAEGGAND